MITLTVKEVMDAAMEIVNRKPEDWQAIQVIDTCDEIPVLYDPSLLHSNGFIIAMAGKIMCDDGTPRPAIVIDNFLQSAPVGSFEFFVAHEEGHIRHGDLDNIATTNTFKRVILSAIGIVQPIELAADAYAAKKVGCDVGINSLSWMFANVTWNSTRKELKKRIKALKKLQKKGY